MNHLRPWITHLPSLRSARVRIMPGSEPPPGAGSVMAKDERTLPSTIPRSQRSFWAGVPARAKRFMLPSSGAMQFNASGPNTDRAASSYIAAQATMGSAMPPNSLGDCGAHSPAAFAFARTGSSRSGGIFSCSEKFWGSRSSGSTCASTKARVRRRTSSVSGVSVKSMVTSSPQRDHLAAVDHDGGASNESPGVRGEQQQGAVEVAVAAEAADRDVAGEPLAFFAGEIVAVDLGNEPARRNGIDADALEGEFEPERLGDLHHPGLGSRIGDDAFADPKSEHRGDVDDGAGPACRQHAARALLGPQEHRVEIGGEYPPPLRL